jgi:hypothetical protein
MTKILFNTFFNYEMAGRLKVTTTENPAVGESTQRKFINVCTRLLHKVSGVKTRYTTRLKKEHSLTLLHEQVIRTCRDAYQRFWDKIQVLVKGNRDACGFCFLFSSTL